MKYPNLKEEKILWKQGHEVVVGLDEAGRGPLAGPVVAAAVFLQKNCRVNLKIQDSKKLTANQRDYFYEKLIQHPKVAFGIGIVSEKEIDKINILQATKLAMIKALKNLQAGSPVGLRPRDFLLLDGNFKINSKIPQKAIIKGDQTVFSISAAGIIAKVTRDRIMRQMHEKYPQYGFHLHKGYGTALHVANLVKFGPCEIHRKSFAPIKRPY